MEDNSVVIVVPLVTPTITGDELMSLRRCLSIFSERNICFICSTELETSFYKALCQEYKVTFSKRSFDAEYFTSVNSYNRLCFSPLLYDTFADYDYMLIYQLDAYVFSDKLGEWCRRGYDYVGGPWLCSWSNDVENLDDWEVGNGGFSLRRVAAFQRILCSPTLRRKPLKPLSRFIHEKTKRIQQQPLLILWYMFRAITGYHNTMHYYISHQCQEDKAFAQCQYNGLLKIPPPRKPWNSASICVPILAIK